MLLGFAFAPRLPYLAHKQYAQHMQASPWPFSAARWYSLTKSTCSACCGETFSGCWGARAAAPLQLPVVPRAMWMLSVRGRKVGLACCGAGINDGIHGIHGTCGDQRLPPLERYLRALVAVCMFVTYLNSTCSFLVGAGQPAAKAARWEVVVVAFLLICTCATPLLCCCAAANTPFATC